jgi:transposase
MQLDAYIDQSSRVVVKDTVVNSYQEDIWRTKFNKLEKQREIELKLKDENQAQIKLALEAQLQQQRESFEVQLRNMIQVTDSKSKECDDLRHFNQVLAQQLNQQIVWCVRYSRRSSSSSNWSRSNSHA